MVDIVSLVFGAALFGYSLGRLLSYTQKKISRTILLVTLLVSLALVLTVAERGCDRMSKDPQPRDSPARSEETRKVVGSFRDVPSGSETSAKVT